MSPARVNEASSRPMPVPIEVLGVGAAILVLGLLIAGVVLARLIVWLR